MVYNGRFRNLQVLLFTQNVKNIVQICEIIVTVHFQSPYISDDLFHFSNICHYRPASQLLCCDDTLNGSVDMFIHLKFNACLLLGIHMTQFDKCSLVCRKMDIHALLYKSRGCQTRGVIVSFFPFIFLS